MYEITKEIQFDAGHRVHLHESKCRTLHGHRYRVEIFARAKTLDEIGRVIDFSEIKKRVGSWIDNFWDHNTLVYEKDVKTIDALKSIPRAKEPFICKFNPTAENMAHYLLHEICRDLFKGSDIEIFKVRLWETPTCSAEVKL